MNTIQTTLQYWPVILFILGLIFHIIWVYFQVGTHSGRLDALEKRMTAEELSNDTFREDIKVTLQEIKTTLVFIREKVK